MGVSVFGFPRLKGKVAVESAPIYYLSYYSSLFASGDEVAYGVIDTSAVAWFDFITLSIADEGMEYYIATRDMPQRVGYYPAYGWFKVPLVTDLSEKTFVVPTSDVTHNVELYRVDMPESMYVFIYYSWDVLNTCAVPQLQILDDSTWIPISGASPIATVVRAKRVRLWLEASHTCPLKAMNYRCRELNVVPLQSLREVGDLENGYISYMRFITNWVDRILGAVVARNPGGRASVKGRVAVFSQMRYIKRPPNIDGIIEQLSVLGSLNKNIRFADIHAMEW